MYVCACVCRSHCVQVNGRVYNVRTICCILCSIIYAFQLDLMKFILFWSIYLYLSIYLSRKYFPFLFGFVISIADSLCFHRHTYRCVCVCAFSAFYTLLFSFNFNYNFILLALPRLLMAWFNWVFRLLIEMFAPFACLLNYQCVLTSFNANDISVK